MTKELTEFSAGILHRHGLKSTYARQCVLQTLQSKRTPLTAVEIHAHTAKAHHPPSLVTVYRILEHFTKKGIVHRHPCDGRFSICTLPHSNEQHAFLHCTSCGKLEEFVLPSARSLLSGISRGKRFRPSECIAEIHGTCARCP